METVYLLLGSNLGDRLGHLKICLARLSAFGRVKSTSAVYETQAWGKTDQPNYLNQVVEFQTPEKPKHLLELILNTELEMGRVRHEQWGSRIIDIDILFYGDNIIDTEKLKVPHPQLPYRRFALTPLAEIAPDYIHPQMKKSIQQLLDECSDTLLVKKVELPAS